MISRDEMPKQIESLAKANSGHITLASDVVAFPLTDATDGYDFKGGLAHSTTLQLIEEAILTRGNKLAQVMPEADVDFHANKVPLKEETVFYGGILLNNFGHFLLESLGRLWAYHLFADFDLPVLFYAPWGTSDYLKKDNYINQILKGFNIPPERILFSKQLVQFKSVVIPEQKYGFGKCRTPDTAFLNFIHSFAIPDKGKQTISNADRIYVSRSGLPFKQGRPIAETSFETFLQANNYLIVHPESLSVYEQLTLYKNAKQIIFCDGGATYATILTPKLEADIAIIARRRDHRWNYKEVTEHFLGYNKSVLWIDEVLAQYQFGMETWDALGEIDWHKVSLTLMETGFVESAFDEVNKQDHEKMKRVELHQYIDSIRQNPLFLNYMENHREQHPVLPGSF